MHCVRVRMAAPASLLLCWCLAACPSPRTASDAEVHTLAVRWVEQDLAASKPLLLHPLLIRATGDTLSLDRAIFNAFDSVSIRHVVALGPELRLCSTDGAGLCQVPHGRVAVALSEIVRPSPREVLVGVVVTDGRSGEPKQRYILLRGRVQGGSWNIAEVSRSQVRP